MKSIDGNKFGNQKNFEKSTINLTIPEIRTRDPSYKNSLFYPMNPRDNLRQWGNFSGHFCGIEKLTKANTKIPNMLYWQFLINIVRKQS